MSRISTCAHATPAGGTDADGSASSMWDRSTDLTSAGTNGLFCPLHGQPRDPLKKWTCCALQSETAQAGAYQIEGADVPHDLAPVAPLVPVDAPQIFVLL